MAVIEKAKPFSAGGLRLQLRPLTP